MNRLIINLVVIVVLAVGLTACDNSPPLEQATPRHTVTIRGQFYTENPDDIQFPVKVLFAIDCSLSMTVSDPANRRIEAVQQFLSRYNTDQYPSVSFAIMLWAGSVLDQTRNGYGDPGFTRNREELDRVILAAREDSYTDYLGSVDDVRTMIENDVLMTSYQQDSDYILPRTKYIVCFFSDGMPQTEGGSVQLDMDIWNEVEDLTQMLDDRNVGQFNFHALFLSSLFRYEDAQGVAQTIPGNEAEFEAASRVLLGMARRGNGIFQEVIQAAQLDFINLVTLQLATEYEIKNIFAYNYNVLPEIETLSPDSDGDGLSDDEEEFEYNTDPMAFDTDDDGLSDFFEIKTQTVRDGTLYMDPFVADSSCTPTISGYWPDQDLDGLTDCEESIKGTFRFVADWDSDGIPDGIEFVMGTNPLEDAYISDLDVDGVFDWLEVRRHTNAIANDPKVRERFAYDVNLRDNGNPDPIDEPYLPPMIRKYSFTISNVSIMETLGETAPGRYGLGPNDNFIRVYVAQVPQDRPNSPPVYRMAEIYVNYDDGDSQTVELSPSDFELID